jgi:hypothetical protein
MPPIFFWHSRCMNFAAADLKSFSVEQEIIRANDKRVLRG